ncbi:hypothetical protein DFJ67_2780 [Asanoa ferruginea]|uniref:Uncharacterized protein n=1 Tax=Asanoa ferruginea TaxID=53367 RepID=A0A3D9ZHB5_9ACTN|nr:hypothetical protein DFJ67_2780 [Asanoa ferruginea]GIF53101.1 hypothetical protein Afe04nite_76400 [Asanoa ferruginea]
MSERSERPSRLSEPELMPRLAERGICMSERGERPSRLSEPELMPRLAERGICVSARSERISKLRILSRAGRAQRSEAHA